MRRIDQQIARLSGGRVRFDPRQGRLSVLDEDGAVRAQAKVRETELRNRLQRLLLNEPPATGGGDPEERAIRLLLTQAERAASMPGPCEALQRLVG